MMIPVRPDNKAEALAAYREAGFASRYDGLRVTGINDLSFLREFPDMLYLELPEEEDSVDPTCLEGLSNLRGLHVESTKAGIDFSCFPELEAFFGKWHNDHRNLDQLQELRIVEIQTFHPKSKDMSDLADITRLDRLEIVRTNVRSLDGIETLEDLQILNIFYGSKLETLEALSNGLPAMRELSLENCNKIEDYSPIAQVERLRRLKLSTCAAMLDLAWTKGMDYLDFFSFVETNVKNGNLSPLLDLPRLRYVGTVNRRHYSHKCEELIALLDKHRDQRAN